MLLPVSCLLVGGALCLRDDPPSDQHAIVAATVIIDSYFWGKPLSWPEYEGIYFNVYEGQSAEWGVRSLIYP